MKKSALDILRDCSPSGRRVSREALLALIHEGWEVYKMVQMVGAPLNHLDKKFYTIIDVDRENRVIFVR